MGTETSGLLWYGVAIEDEFEELGERFDVILNGPDEDDDLYGDGREWMAERGISGIEFVTHCSYEAPMYGIAVAGTVTKARRGYPARVETTQVDPAPVLAALEELGIEVAPDSVGWHLASIWG